MTSRVIRMRLLPAVLAIALGGAAGPLPLSAAPRDAAAKHVALLVRAQDSHQEAAAALRRDLQDAEYKITLIELPVDGDEAAQEDALRRLTDAQPTIVVSSGTKATSLALDLLPQVPVVFFMVPNAPDAPFMAPDHPDRRRVAGVTTDIAPQQQLDWLTALCPGARTIGVLTSERSRRTASTIEAVGRTRGLSVTTVEANKDQFPAAIEALNGYTLDGILMIPDAQVYNSLSVQRLLLWGVRQKKPVLAFSPHVVEAGALAREYPDNHALGRQTARVVRRILEGTDISSIGIQYPNHVDYAVNNRTADLIGVTLSQARMPRDTVHYGGNP